MGDFFNDPKIFIDILLIISYNNSVNGHVTGEKVRGATLTFSIFCQQVMNM